MSKLQLQRSVEQNQRYALCIVDITRYTGSNDRYQLLIQDILPLTKFVTNIGETIMPLIEDNLEAEKNKDKSDI
jgi:cystathionine beta-lyase family protein involved in aluminum resistance